MTIAEMPRQALGVERFLGTDLCLRFLQPMPLGRLWRGMRCLRKKQADGETRTARRCGAQGKAEFAPSAVTDSLPSRRVEKAVRHSVKSSNAPLESLAGGTLAARFHAWHGRSGRRYICSVFPVNSAEFDAGLPDFAEAVIIAAACAGDGTRRFVSICQCETGAIPYARESFVIEALAAGTAEWHVHLLATEVTQRRAVIADIEAMRHGIGSWRAPFSRLREKVPCAA